MFSRGVAQLVARQFRVLEAWSSNLHTSTKKGKDSPCGSLFLFFVGVFDSTPFAPCAKEFAYPARRSKNQFFRRRAQICSQSEYLHKTDSPCGCLFSCITKTTRLSRGFRYTIMLKTLFVFFILFSFQFEKLSDSPRRIAGRKLKLKNYSFAPRVTGIADSNAIDAMLRSFAVAVPAVKVITFSPA